MVFGFLIGIAGFLGVAFLGGFVDAPEAEAVSSEVQYASATDRLEKYRCRAGETKKVILGGIEDGFDPAGEELVNIPQTILDYLGKTGGIYTDFYDDPRQNRYFADQFDIPKRTFHGIISMRVEDRSSVKNDSINLGYYVSRNYNVQNKAFYDTISNILNSWNQDGSYIWADLDDLKTHKIEGNKNGRNEIVGLSHLSLLDAIRSNEDRMFEVHIADDTIVDFVGFALCLEPEVHKGSTFSRYHSTGAEATLEFGDGFVNLYGWGKGYDGNTLCSEKRPVACIDDQNLAAPEPFNNLNSMLWSGGYIKFTDAVPGNRFETEDEVNLFCKSTFGDKFRAVSKKDGTWMGSMVGYGNYPVDYDDFWATYKDSPHHNCWSLRRDYDDLARLEATQ